MSTIYVGPSATGNDSGSSASNTLGIGSLDKAIQLAGAGGTVVLLSDHGAYNLTSTINLSHGGADGAAVTIVGQDSSGNAANVEFDGTRAATYTAGMAEGNVVFRLTTGANDLNFQHITFNNVGMAFLAAFDVHDIAISNMTANNVEYFFGDYASQSGGTATVSNLSVSNVDVHGFSKGVIRLQYDSHDIAISNVFGDSMHEDGDGIASGVHFDGTAHDATVVGCTMENAIATSATYWNGDGFTAERGNYNLVFQDCTARGNADAGFDIKAVGTVLSGCIAEDNARNFRLWADGSLINCQALDPHKFGGTGGQEQIQVIDGAQVTVTGGVFADSGSATQVVSFDGGGNIAFNGTQVVHADTGTLISGSGTYVLSSADLHTVVSTGTYSTNGASLLAPSTPVVVTTSDPTDTAQAPATDSSGSKGHKTITYSGDVGTGVVANPGLHGAGSSVPIASSTSATPGTGSTTVHVYGGASPAQLLAGLDATDHAAAGAHLAPVLHGLLPELGAASDFDHAHVQLFASLHLHGSDLLF